WARAPCSIRLAAERQPRWVVREPAQPAARKGQPGRRRPVQPDQAAGATSEYEEAQEEREEQGHRCRCDPIPAPALGARVETDCRLPPLVDQTSPLVEKRRPAGGNLASRSRPRTSSRRSFTVEP